MEIEDLEEAIAHALVGKFPGLTVDFDPYPGHGKVHGVLTWDKFAGVAHIDRQKMIWDVLRAELTEDQVFLTGLLLMVTPREMAAMQDAAA